MKLVEELRRLHRQKALEDGLNPRDVDLLLADQLGRSVTYLIGHGEEPVGSDAVVQLEAQLARRRTGEPLQYIRGRTEFFSRTFFVDRRVLIPRPETELAVEAVIEATARGGRVLDVGTGSGCIAISIERERHDLRVTASDREVEALAVASRNASALGSNVRLVAMDLFEGIGGEFDVVVSNPPYIPTSDLEGLEVEVRGFEPRGALSPGPCGLETIERLLVETPVRLAREGRLIVEIGWGQSEAVASRAAETGWQVERIINDLAAIPRVIVLRRP